MESEAVPPFRVIHRKFYCIFLLHRKEQLEYVCGKLKLYFKNYPECNVYLTGSIVRPGSFSDGSDIDIAVENYAGSRLDLFMELSELIELPVDLIIMERCQFAYQFRKNGIRVLLV